MDNIVERIVEICREKKIPVTKLEKDLGYGNGYLNPKKVSDMKAGRLLEILDYLGISMEEFFNIGTTQTQTIETALKQIEKASPSLYDNIMNNWLGYEDKFYDELQSMRDDPDFRVLLNGYKKMKNDPNKVKIMKKFVKSLEEEDDTIAD